MALVIPKNKSELIFDIDATTSGVVEKQVVIEDDAFAGILIVTAGSATLEVFEQINGQAVGDAIASSELGTATSVQNLYADSSNNIIVRLTYTGPARVQVKGKGVGKRSASGGGGTPAEDRYKAVQVNGIIATVDHQFGRYPLVEVITGVITGRSDAFTFDGYRLDAFAGGQTQFQKVEDSEYTITYLDSHRIRFEQTILRDVIILLRA